MTTTKLHNGDEMMLVEVPEGAFFQFYWKDKGWGDTSNWILETRKDTPDGSDVHCVELKIPAAIKFNILGTFYKGEIDFEVKEEWVEKTENFYAGTMYRQYEPARTMVFPDGDSITTGKSFVGVLNSKPFTAKNSFLSLLQSLTDPNKKYVILLETKK